MFKGITQLGALMRQAQEMSGRMQQVRQQLQAQLVTGEAGGGMVTVECNGLGQIVRVRIDPILVERNEREMIEDLTAAATNDAIAKARQLHMDAMRELTAGVDLPGLEAALQRMAGMDPDGT